ncbi:protein crossbronx homolog [Cryptotermes secundus]|uniref:protein crossbronx homolog n=1 Tax=Cryptotermes secundus TaxID=105785 RepID=UPI000CD7DDA6|nr:protein crossbronx homolog [Cryptotermes secundus]
MATGQTGQNDLNVDVTEPFRRQGSFRKVLPSLPSADPQLSMSAKMIDRPAVSNRGHQKAYSLYQQEYCIISEYNMLQKQELPGIYVIPSAKSSLLWFGVFFVRQGVYEGGVFRFCIHIPEAFPDGGCPRVVFQSMVFHPMINPSTGEMDVRSGFEEWRKNVNHIWQVVQYVRRAFYKIETKSPFNQKASELYEKNQEEFCESVKLCVKASQEQIYDRAPTDDLHYITFEPYDNEVHGPIRDTIFKIKENEQESSSAGLSWVQPGSLEPFSKPTS